MKVVLLKNVSGTGNAGEAHEVKEGFAKNFLFPRGLAAMPNDSLAQKFLADKEKIDREKSVQLNKIQSEIQKIDGSVIEILAKVNPKGQLFAGINLADIKREIGDRFGVTPESASDLPIKSLGTHSLQVNFKGNLKANIKLVVKELS